MNGPPYQKPEIEKIRKVTWSPENTKRTADVVVRLTRAKHALALCTGDTPLIVAMQHACDRLCELDPAARYLAAQTIVDELK